MNRRTFITRVAFGLVAAPLTSHAQLAGNVRRIGYLAPGPSSPSDAAGIAAVQSFRQGLRELGWIEGQNIVVDYRFAEGRFDRLPDLAAELVRLKVDLIVATTTPAAAAAKNATATIPIVMVSVGDPVGLGLIASLARPGGNVTGQAFSAGMEIYGKQLELLKEAVPKVRRVAILSNPANPSHALAISNVRAAARSLSVELQLLEARDPDEFDGAFAAMVKERVGALLIVSDPMFGLHAAQLATLAGKNQLPSIHGVRQMVDPGASCITGRIYPSYSGAPPPMSTRY
jgi:putative ABC transport system substrate-binding protein